MPASRPKPLSTTSGRASAMSSRKTRIEAEVCPADLSTIAVPAVRAGAIFHTPMSIGKSEGMF